MDDEKKTETVENPKLAKKKEIPAHLKKKCHAIIHTATVAAGASGLIPFPVADTIPMSAAQVTMVLALGKVFGIAISESTAQAIASVTIAQAVGKGAVSSAFKFVPGMGTIAGMAVASTTGATLTEVMGWVVADAFYRIMLGEETEENLLDSLSTIQKDNIFDKKKWVKRGERKKVAAKKAAKKNHRSNNAK